MYCIFVRVTKIPPQVTMVVCTSGTGVVATTFKKRRQLYNLVPSIARQESSNVALIIVAAVC